MVLTKEEKETLVWTDEALGVWGIKTMSYPMMRKLDKLYGAKKTEMDRGEIYSKEYEVPMSCVSFRKIRERRVLTDEEKEANEEKGKRMRDGKKGSFLP